jgi:hypothetical protein
VKRYLLPAALLAALTFTLTPGTTYTYVVKELSQTMTGVFTFGAGATIPSGQKLFIGDSGNNNYLYGEASTQFVKVYINGALKATITGNGVIPGPCPSDLSAIELNTECSSNGRRVWRDIDGTWVSTTSGKRPAQ